MDGPELKTTPKAAKILAGGMGSPTMTIPEVKGPGLAERESRAQSQGRDKPGPRSVCGGGGGSSWYTLPHFVPDWKYTGSQHGLTSSTASPSSASLLKP